MIDEDKLAAYELSVEADQLAVAGRMDAARQKMSRAAELDATYEIRARLLGAADGRSVKPAAAIRRILVPALKKAGFTLVDKPFHFTRVRGQWTDAVNIGTVKFGGAIGVLAARYPDPDHVAYFDWRLVGNRTGTYSYRTRSELEAVCQRWAEVLEMILLPWFAAGDHPSSSR